MHDISQKLALATEYGTWNPKPPATEEDLTNLKFEAGVEIRLTPEGARLKAAGLLPRLLEVFAEHYAGSVPSKIPYFEELLLVARDLDLEIPNKPAPVIKTEPKETAVQKAQREEAEKAEKAEAVRKVRARNFADAVNSQIHRDGARSVRANGGFHYIGRKSYSVTEFNELYKTAEAYGFFGDCNVYSEDRNVYLK